MFEVPLVQDGDAWLAWRSQGITATEAGIVMGANPYTTPWRLWAERTGKVSRANLDINPNVRRGENFEDMARNAYNEMYGVMLVPTCGEYEGNRVIRASFDGIDENGVPGEIKIPHDKTFADVEANRENSDSYKLHWHQVQHQMLVAGSKIGRLFFYNPATRMAIPFEIERDEDFLTRLVEKEMAMWTAIQTLTPPPLDPERDLYQPEGDDEGAWLALVLQWKSHQARIAELEAETKPLEAAAKKLEERMKTMMGDFRLAQYGGVKVNRYFQEGSIDYQAALMALRPETSPSETETYRRKGGMRMRVSAYEVAAERDTRPEDNFEIVSDHMAIDY